MIRAGAGGRPIRVAPVRLLTPGTSIAGKPTWQAPKPTISYVGTDGLWSPGQPTNPISPAGTEPRGLQYLNFQNMIFTPRASEEYAFDDLRRLSRYPVARMLIESRKDQLKALPWQVRVKAQEGETNEQRLAREKGDKTISKLSGFLERPNFDCDWGDFCSMWTDEMLVHDAPSILIRRTRAGDLGELRVIDGAMIVRYIDQNGWTPVAKNPDGSTNPAYAQLWWGMPGWNMTTDQLFYRPRNPRAHKIYGFSKTEMAADYIELGWKRLEMMQRHYTDGMIPDGIQVVPKGISRKDVDAQQEHLRAMLAGNLARLAGMAVVQGFTEKGDDKFLFPKNELVLDASVDELIMRILCFIYGVSYVRLMKQMNRASMESGQEASEEEGLEPDKKYIRDKTNQLIWKLGFQNYEFTFQETRERDILKQAQADQIYLTCGVNTVNEVRKNKGDDPSPDPMANILLIKTGTGTVPLGEVAAPAAPEAEDDQSANADQNAQPKGKGKKKPQGEPEPAPKKKPKSKQTDDTTHPVQRVLEGDVVDVTCGMHDTFEKTCHRCIRATQRAGSMKVLAIEKRMEDVLTEHMEKSRSAFHLVIDPHYTSPQSEQAKHVLQDKMQHGLKKCAAALVARAKKAMAKADDDETIIKKILGDDDFWHGLWATLPAELQPALEQAALAGMTKSVVEAQVHISEAGMINEFNAIAKAWAQEHAASMVGMRYDGKGNLVPNPNAKYSIADSTRNQIRDIITDAFKQDSPLAGVTAAIEDAGAFKSERAATIARTEVSNAQVQGNVAVWQRLGLVQTVKWQTSNNPNVCDDCADNAEAGEVEFGKAFPSGDMWPTAHPNCRCVLVSVKLAPPQRTAA